MATTHSTITDPEIHEPKGVAEATAGTVYRADGAGSGSWEAPLTLIERRALTGATSEEFTGLSSYRNLILVVESVTWGTAASHYPIIQVSTASTYRTSGYYNGWLGSTTDSTNITTAGLLVGFGASTVLNGYGIIEINNLNAAYPTSCTSTWQALSVNRINTSSAPGAIGLYSMMGIYPTAEAHEKIKFLSSAGYTMSSGFLTLYGI